MPTVIGDANLTRRDCFVSLSSRQAPCLNLTKLLESKKKLEMLRAELSCDCSTLHNSERDNLRERRSGVGRERVFTPKDTDWS